MRMNTTTTSTSDDNRPIHKHLTQARTQSTKTTSTPTPSISPTTTTATGTDLRKMGSSFIRHCRRRTQSDPPKKYKRDRQNKTTTATGVTAKEHRQQIPQTTQNSLVEGIPHGKHTVVNSTNINTLGNDRKNTNGVSLALPLNCGATSSSSPELSNMNRTNYRITSTESNNTSSTLRIPENYSSNATGNTILNNRTITDNTEKTRTDNSTDMATLRQRKTSHCSTANTNKDIQFANNNATGRRSSESSCSNTSNVSKSSGNRKNSKLSSSNTVLNNEKTPSSISKSNCFSKFICCRRNRRDSGANSFQNNNVFPYTLEEYLRVPDSPLSSNADSRSTCFSSLSTEVNSSSNRLSPTLGGSLSTTLGGSLSADGQSRAFSSENSSTNLSHDSGFDEPKCFINMIYQNHLCKGYYSCHKKDKASLNIHLKNLMNCMPRSGDQITDPLNTSTGTCLSKRRNAICETSDDTKVKFYDALCAFMTLQAMAKYDFL